MFNFLRRNKTNILNEMKINENEFTRIVNENPSLRGMILGYVAEHKFKKMLETKMFISSKKDDDHDRTKKGDRRFKYNGKEYTVEVKSIQTNSIKQKEDGSFQGKTQVDASDSRNIVLPDGSELKTTCLLRNEFDILAINLYPFTKNWEFAFIKNKDIPNNKFVKYTEQQRKHLLPTTLNVDYPIKQPFVKDIRELLY